MRDISGRARRKPSDDSTRVRQLLDIANNRRPSHALRALLISSSAQPDKAATPNVEALREDLITELALVAAGEPAKVAERILGSGLYGAVVAIPCTVVVRGCVRTSWQPIFWSSDAAVDGALSLLLDDRKPFLKQLRRCGECGTFFLARRPKVGQPKLKYCSTACYTKHDRTASAERVRRMRERRALEEGK
ncbi:MAG TPA: hypothetical protein VLX90_00125 [Steroidobacteraceae bacterium]|nr:hypothetical protein [Steroidobacteraceae bacterium]